MYHTFFFQLSMEGCFGCLHVLATINNTAMNTGEHIFLWINVFKIFWWNPRRGVVGSYGHSTLNFLKKLLTAFHSGCTGLHSEQHWIRIPFSPQPLQHYLSLILLIIAILTDNSHSNLCWYLIMILICISLASEIEHLFKYVLAIYMSSWDKCLLRSFVFFFMELFVWYWVVWVLYTFFKTYF